MSSNRDKSTRVLATAVLAASVAAHGCSDDDFDSYGYYDPYGYYYDSYYGYAYPAYYPTDLAYTESMYADPWYGAPAVYIAAPLPKGESSSALPSDSLRALALGEDICPGQVSVSTERMKVSCGEGSLPARTSIGFDDCELRGGGRLDGSIEIEAQHTFSDDACGASTRVTVSYTSTSTDLEYTAPSGARVVLPSMTRSGSFERPLAGRPSMLNVSIDGRVEHYSEEGKLLAGMDVAGTQTLSLDDAERGYVTDGELELRDTVRMQTASVSASGVARTYACCYPTAGTLEIARPGAGADVWSFGPDCGDVSRNGARQSISACF